MSPELLNSKAHSISAASFKAVEKLESIFFNSSQQSMFGQSPYKTHWSNTVEIIAFAGYAFLKDLKGLMQNCAVSYVSGLWFCWLKFLEGSLL